MTESYFKLRSQILEGREQVFPLLRNDKTKKRSLDIEIFKNHEGLRNLLSDVLSYIFGLESLKGLINEIHYASFLITDFLKGSGTICYPVEYYKKNSTKKWNNSIETKEPYNSIFKNYSEYEHIMESEGGKKGEKIGRKYITVVKIIEDHLNNTPLLVVRENNQFISKKIVPYGTPSKLEQITKEYFSSNPPMEETFLKLINSHNNLLPSENQEAFFIYLPIELDASKRSAGSLFIVCLGNDKTYENYINGIMELHHNIEYYLSYIFISVLQEYKFLITLKNAIITILVDSYAHNVSAHSLSYLEWWLRFRSSELELIWYINNKEDLGNIRPKSTDINKNLIQKISNISYERYYKPQGLKSSFDENFFSLLDIMNYMPKNIERELLSLEKKFKQSKNPSSKDEENPRFPVPIDHVMRRFLKYLQCKAAFWSGVTREKTFGGEIKNLYSVLWEDFANNPLFLGTIAASERIFKVDIYIQFKNLDGIFFEGEFVEIDLSIVSQITKGTKDHSVNHEEKNKGNEDPQNGSIYNFVRLKNDFQKIKEKLVELKVFFPGGVVGEHAFFTILENTLRNVKHIDKDDLEDIANDRLQLYISLTDCGRIIKVGTWLNHPVDLIDKKSERPERAVIFRLKEKLENQIINDKGSPILGGTSQDKICASMLYNNTFQLVEDNSKKEVYPWIKVASAVECESDFFPDNNNEKDYIEKYNSKKGIIKRYFSLWKGENLKGINEESDLEDKNENVSRFRFVNICQKNEKKYDDLFSKARSAGIIRILKNVEIEDLYKNWLQNWNKNCSTISLERGDYYGIINLSNNNIVSIFRIDFSNDNVWREERKKLIVEDLPQNRYKQICLCKLKKSGKLLLGCAHSGSSENKSPESILDIRSHGDFVKYFFNAESIDDVPNKKISEEKIGEFIETVITQVCIFDNRLNQRIISKEKRILFDNVLGMTFYEENIDKWNDLRGIMDNYHFLVIHLSFIEKLGYHEDDIDKFIEKEIAPNPSDIHENFIITIVTGRGREAWWKELNLKYKKFVTFRPIESLLGAVEDGIMLKDDFQVKYNLVKVLFGS